MARRRITRFTDHFNITASQAEVDFVDIPLQTDIPLTIDPYALHIQNDPWFQDCADLVRVFFDELVRLILEGNEHTAIHLLSNLGEPNETRLGFSSGVAQGRGIGTVQAQQLYTSLRQSQAVQNGHVESLADCELMIPGIGHDKISDIVINVIRGKLIDYTINQCTLLNVETHNQPVNPYFNGNTRRWVAAYAQLPMYNNLPLLLVPKLAVRKGHSYSHAEFYNKNAMEYLRREHLTANTGLVETLKNGTRRVTKRRLKERYPLDGKNFIYDFVADHPDELERYKEDAKRKAAENILADEEIEAVNPRHKPLDYDVLIDSLGDIPSGTQTANQYHEFCIRILTCAFQTSLRDPIKELEINEGTKRVDIGMTNRATSGFFNDLRTMFGLHAPYVMIECKNYSKDVNNPELDQLLGRLDQIRGKFGIMLCRTVNDRDRWDLRCKQHYEREGKLVLALTDENLIQILEFASEAEYDSIDNYLHNLIRPVAGA